MTRTESTAAATAERRVRLLDRSRAFYVDEWYEPAVNDDGTLNLHTHTGEDIDVDDDLLTQLTAEPAVTTVGYLRCLLERYPRRHRGGAEERPQRLRRHHAGEHRPGAAAAPHGGAYPRGAVQRSHVRRTSRTRHLRRRPHRPRRELNAPQPAAGRHHPRPYRNTAPRPPVPERPTPNARRLETDTRPPSSNP